MITKTLTLLLTLSVFTVGAMAQSPEPGPKPEPRVFSWAFSSTGGYLGIEMVEISKENAAKFGLSSVRGVGVDKVVAGSPAERAGIASGDVIVRVNGEEITSTQKLSRLIGEIAPDHQARISVIRNGSEKELTVTIGKRSGSALELGSMQWMGPEGRNEMPRIPEFPELSQLPRGEIRPLPPGTPEAPMFFRFGPRRQIGIGVTPLTKQLADHFGVENGAIVNNVRENSPAAKAGIKAGDIIVEVDGKAVRSDFDLSRAVSEKKDGSVVITIVRDRDRRSISVMPEEVKGGLDRFFDFSSPDAPDAPGLYRQLVPPRSPAPPMLDRMIVPGRVI